MSDHDGHTVAVGPVTVGIDTAAFRQGHRRLAREGVCLMCGFWPCPVRRLCDEVDRLRDLLAKALPWVDPNDSHEDYLLTVEIRQALGEES